MHQLHCLIAALEFLFLARDLLLQGGVACSQFFGHAVESAAQQGKFVATLEMGAVLEVALCGLSGKDHQLMERARQVVANIEKRNHHHCNGKPQEK
ncbi:hypothetical protein VRRI112168_20445 [Vreelandella rituensis]